MYEGNRQLQEIKLKEFRCFSAEQAARLAPLTLLVGDNSTGKTSFLAAVRAICDIAFRQREPDFREPPFDLGTFPQIVHDPGIRRTSSETFGIGVRAMDSIDGVLGCEATFRSGPAAAPCLSSGRANYGDLWIEWRDEANHRVAVKCGSNDSSWHTTTLKEPDICNWTWMAAHVYSSLWKGRKATDESFVERESDQLARMILIFEAARPEWYIFAAAPVRSVPRRTYDPTRPSTDPHGDNVPTYLASMQFRGEREWTPLKNRMEEFGRASGLFDEFSIKQFGGREGAPFQLEIRKFGNRRKGSRRNLIDMGYGVGQVLPLLVQLVRPDSPSLFLFQQPEVHLHPSAQAALGSLFCETAASGRQLIVETHSDYILNRVRLDVRDRRTELKPEEVSILYFERDDLDVRIHSMRIDEDGNVLNAPNGYRRFFTDELNRSLDY